MKILLPAQYETVVNVVCGHFNVSQKELKSKLRTERIANVRHIIWYLVKTLTGVNMSTIASASGNDSGTIRYDIVRVCEGISISKDFAATVTYLESRCKLLLEAK